MPVVLKDKHSPQLRRSDASLVGIGKMTYGVRPWKPTSMFNQPCRPIHFFETFWSIQMREYYMYFQVVVLLFPETCNKDSSVAVGFLLMTVSFNPSCTLSCDPCEQQRPIEMTILFVRSFCRGLLLFSAVAAGVPVTCCFQPTLIFPDHIFWDRQATIATAINIGILVVCFSSHIKIRPILVSRLCWVDTIVKQ